jgi:hypothetical protein
LSPDGVAKKEKHSVYLKEWVDNGNVLCLNSSADTNPEPELTLGNL